MNPVPDNVYRFQGRAQVGQAGAWIFDRVGESLRPHTPDHGRCRELRRRILDRFHARKERAVTVRDVMTPVIHQVPVTASVAEAARLMVDQHIHRLVVTQGKEPVGIITSLDLLKVLTKQP